MFEGETGEQCRREIMVWHKSSKNDENCPVPSVGTMHKFHKIYSSQGKVTALAESRGEVCRINISNYHYCGPSVGTRNSSIHLAALGDTPL